MRPVLSVGFLIALFSFVGCGPQNVILDDLDEPLGADSHFAVVTIQDRLPATTAPGDRPTQEQIDKLRVKIAERLRDADDLHWSEAQGGIAADYEIRGSLVDFDPGNGFVRFMIGFGAGTARMTVILELVSTWDDTVVFSGRYEGVVSSWVESGDQMFDRVARAFVGHLEKQQESLVRGESSR